MLSALAPPVPRGWQPLGLPRDFDTWANEPRLGRGLADEMRPPALLTSKWPPGETADFLKG